MWGRREQRSAARSRPSWPGLVPAIHVLLEYSDVRRALAPGGAGASRLGLSRPTLYASLAGRSLRLPTVPGSGNNVTKPELGTKRICAGCNAKFYDLHKTPIVCPACEAVFTLPKPAPARPRRGFEPSPVAGAGRGRARERGGGVDRERGCRGHGSEDRRRHGRRCPAAGRDGRGLSAPRRLTRRHRRARRTPASSRRQLDDLVDAVGGVVDRHLHDGVPLLDDQSGGFGSLLRHV